MRQDTIAAIATAMTNAGIGIVRISGDNSIPIIEQIFKPKKKDKIMSKVQSHTLHYGYLVDGDEVIDEVMVAIMRAPHSYTTEDTVEIDCHGGILVMKRIMETVIRYGARPAEPGEFTKRAFLNGRIDLSQAEAVIDVLNAKNDLALKSSVSQLRGSVSQMIREIRDKVIYHIAFIESALDDPEHISLEGYPEELNQVVKEQSSILKKLLDQADNGRIIKEGIKAVILGKPNAGKSSLLNLLLGEDRAIVTDIAGTTRDALEETIYLNGVTLNIIDTAGIRETQDVVEKIGVSKAKEYAKDADLIIYVVDSSTKLDESDAEIISMLKDKQVIVLLNKTDLNPVTTREMLKKEVKKDIISISAKEKQGLDELEQWLKDKFYEGEISFNDQVYITNIRHKDAISQAYESLNQVLESIKMNLPEDFFSIDLMSAYEALGSILGESVGEDLVNEIFSKFCTGK